MMRFAFVALQRSFSLFRHFRRITRMYALRRLYSLELLFCAREACVACVYYACLNDLTRYSSLRAETQHRRVRHPFCGSQQQFDYDDDDDDFIRRRRTRTKAQALAPREHR